MTIGGGTPERLRTLSCWLRLAEDGAEEDALGRAGVVMRVVLLFVLWVASDQSVGTRAWCRGAGRKERQGYMECRTMGVSGQECNRSGGCCQTIICHLRFGLATGRSDSTITASGSIRKSPARLKLARLQNR